MADTLGTPFFLPVQAQLAIARAKLYFYETTTTTGEPAYKDVRCKAPHPNPVRADIRGKFPPIYLNPDAEDSGASGVPINYTAQLDSIDDQDEASTTTLFDIDDIPSQRENFYTGAAGGTYTGFAADPVASGNYTYYQYGRLVNLILPAVSATSDATNLTWVTLPARIRPAVIQYGHIPYATDNSAHLVGGCTVQINTDGQLHFAPADAGYSETGWTNTGTKGIAAQHSLWYRLDDG